MTNESTTAAALRATDLRVATLAGLEILHGIDFELHPGRILALVGESGSGKTTAGLACMGHFRQGLKLTAGSVQLGCEPSAGNLLELSAPKVRVLRGGSIS
ncbi:MAG: ATP-binding cassette domain-containing protein, partial [Micrococcaceae bacterium]|nr:ATP-binding cassette domain-containing protein [Micrococcaceae bacterium]